jgi:hypothetical protein
MLFEPVIKILNKSREEKCDILVARDKLCIGVDPTGTDLEKACKFILDNYDAVTKCRKMNDESRLERLVTAFETDEKAFKEMLEELKEIEA